MYFVHASDRFVSIKTGRRRWGRGAARGISWSLSRAPSGKEPEAREDQNGTADQKRQFTTCPERAQCAEQHSRRNQ